MSQIGNIKARIKTLLDELVTSSDLALIIEDDFKENFDHKDISAYPVAILSTASVSSDYHTNRQNLRTHTYEVVIIMKGEDISGVSEVEDLLETILNKFDNDPTLNGTAHGGLEPSSTSPAAVSSADQSYIIFTITLQAKAIIDLTF